MLTGKHLINGEWLASDRTFHAVNASSGENLPIPFCDGGATEADAAARGAENAFAEYANLAPNRRADFLRAIGEELDKRGEEITETAGLETALPAGRLQNERARTVGQIRMFADMVENNEIEEQRFVKAMPDRTPPRPEICLRHCPVGPVAVFGASNFPLAFSAAGGDVASALAAGCPVIVKSHPAHPGTSELAAQAIFDAAKSCDMPSGVYSLVQGTSHQLSRAFVAHPLVRAVGFTGSLAAGRALFDIASARPEPIPFYGEMGSINPMFLLPQAAESRGAQIAAGWVESLTLGAGQFCTNPGVVICVAGKAADNFVREAAEKISAANAQTMLTPQIDRNFKDGVKKMSQTRAQQCAQSNDGTGARPVIFEVGADEWLQDDVLREEIFGPAGIVVRCADEQAMRKAAAALDGQLTATLHADDGDETLARALIPVLERKAGRLICNGFPTGVEVCEAMMHGGPYPASTHSGFTSVGALAVRRFLRPVCYQNFNEKWIFTAR